MEQQVRITRSATEREDLLELLSIPGWQRFVNAVLREYHSEGYRARMQAAIANNDFVKVKVIEAMVIEVEKLLTYPSNRVDELEATRDEEDE